MRHATLVALTIDETTGRVSYVRLPDPDSGEGDDMDLDGDTHAGHLDRQTKRNCSQCNSQQCQKFGRCG